jgi:hypothetical protein
MVKVALTGGAYTAHSVIAAAQRIACVMNGAAYLRSRANNRTHQRERQLLPRQLHVDTAVHAIRESTPLFRVEAPR